MQGRRLFAGALALATLLLGTACASDQVTGSGSGGDGSGDGSGDQGVVRISGQSFPEATLVTSMYSQLLSDAGYDPQVELVDTRDVYMQQFPGEVDVVPEYVGGIVNFLNTTQNGPEAESLTTNDASETIESARDLLAGQGIELLQPSEATDTNAFFVTEEYAQRNDLQALSDLEGMEVVLAAAPDCEGRQDCQVGLEQTYGITITQILPLGFASNQTYQAVLDGEAQLGLTSTTDGTLESQGLVLLDDDKNIQPAQNLVPAVSEEFLAEHPDLPDVLNPLMESLTTEKLTELNRQVAVERQKPEDVARQFLIDEGLLDG